LDAVTMVAASNLLVCITRPQRNLLWAQRTEASGLRNNGKRKRRSWGRTGVWAQHFMFAKQTFYHWSHASSPFSSGYFDGGGLLKYLLRLASNHNPPNISLPSS
jgi:hypothetical protein